MNEFDFCKHLNTQLPNYMFEISWSGITKYIIVKSADETITHGFIRVWPSRYGGYKIDFKDDVTNETIFEYESFC